ncbi:MAG TPA: class I SAM-dependent methyltransferase [Casimicrobiaceae bacterium]|nr:class I SAM-dependent methyltransferase [Casimicrobiaceae bacterium]
MSPWAERLNRKYFGDAVHPYAVFEDVVKRYLLPGKSLLDAGCGYGAPVLRRYVGSARELIGIDLVDFDEAIPGITLLKRDLTDTGLPDGSVDVIMSRSVMEHISEPLETYMEMSRLLRPSGHFIFLTANMWDYSAIIAKLVPNRFHPWIVARTQGRDERDTFPVQYKTNTRRAVERLAAGSGLDVVSFDYLGQYPAYFLFSGPLFLLGTAYEKLINRFTPLHFLKGWILVVLRKPG